MFGAPLRRGQWILKSLTLSVGCGAWWRQLHLPLRSHHPKRPLATRIGYVHLQFFPTPLKRHRLRPEQHKRRLRNGLRDFNGAIPAATDRKEGRIKKEEFADHKSRGRPAFAKMATARQARLPLQLGHASPHLSGAVPDAALLLLVHSEFVCWHAFLASRRIDC